MATGQVSLLIGTHALLYAEAGFQNLRLIITDEQHRFGVAQRAALAGGREDLHTLVMSATPIPRTLALILFGKTQISEIRELPPGRQPVKTFVVGINRRAKLYQWVHDRVMAVSYTHLPISPSNVGIRDVGPDEACLYDDDMFAELIADSRGIHVKPHMLRMVVKIKGLDRIILVTDHYPSD